MELSKRLRMLADLVTQGNRLADVGTDHGYVPIYLLEKGRIPSAIAMDINRGPLGRAKEHIRQYGFETYIECRLSDGLQALKTGEADTLLIAGMGGGLVRRILMEGRETAEGIPEWILQPQSELYQVRGFLVEQGYAIVQEHMVYEDGKYYPAMKVTPQGARALKGASLENYTEAELHFGKVCLQQEPDIFSQYLEKGLVVQGQILKSLANAQGERSQVRRREVEQMIEYMRESLNEAREVAKAHERNFHERFIE